MSDLRNIETAKIQADPKNPRIVFPEEELQRLTESISKEGVLVPLVLYPSDSTFTLVDGERRWRCALTLGLEEVPAIVVEPPDNTARLLQMFNIHMVREPWQDMPTAWALNELIKATGITEEKALSDRTGLSTERVRRLKYALDLPVEYQKYIHEGRIPLNFFWELKRNVIEPLLRHRPVLWRELGEDEVLHSFVKKRLSGVVTDSISLRNVRPIIRMAAEEQDESTGTSPLDRTLRDLIRDEAVTINDAYEDTVMVLVEAEKLQKRSDSMIRAFDRLLTQAKSSEEREFVLSIGRDLVGRLARLLGLKSHGT